MAAEAGGAAQTLLPAHLQSAVQFALGELKAQRLLYPQQCAAAEELGQSEREQAERRVLSSLGGTFDYAAARSDLDDAQTSSKALARRWRRGGKERQGGAEAAARLGASAPPRDLWASFEASSAALAAEVDRRIAAAGQHQASSAANPAVFRARQPAGSAADHQEPPERLGCRPVRSMQAEGVAQPAAAAAPLAAARKRERSPRPSQQRDRASAGVQGRQTGGDAVPPPAAPARPPAGAPANKRRRPHVAFGTRCEALRPRSQRPVRLEAEQAPTPPQLPPARPPAAGQAGGAGQAAAEAAAQPDLLRLLAATFAGQDIAPTAPSAAIQVHGGDDPGAPPGSAGTLQMQQLLSALTATLGDHPQRHSDQTSGLLRSAGCCRMEAMSPQPLHASTAGLEAAASLAALEHPKGSAATSSGAAPAPPAPGDSCAAALALCDRFDLLLQSSGRELGEARCQLATARRAGEAVGSIQAAAFEAAVAAAEAAVPDHRGRMKREEGCGAPPAQEVAATAVQAEDAATAAVLPAEHPLTTENGGMPSAAAAIGGSLCGCSGNEPGVPAAAHRPDAAQQPERAQSPVHAVPAVVAAAVAQPVVGWPAAAEEAASAAAAAGFPIWDPLLPFSGPACRPVPAQPAARPTQAFVTYHRRQAPGALPPRQPLEERAVQRNAASSNGHSSPLCGRASSCDGAGKQTTPLPGAVDAGGDEEAPLSHTSAPAIVDAVAGFAIAQPQQPAAAAAAPEEYLALDAAACAMHGSAPASPCAPLEAQQEVVPPALAAAPFLEGTSRAAAELGVAMPLPAASSAPPRPPTYNPLRSGAAAAAGREDAAAWRRLREQADRVVLWHEYAAALGIGGDDMQESAEPGEQPQAAAAPDPTAEHLPRAAQLCGFGTAAPACNEDRQQAHTLRRFAGAVASSGYVLRTPGCRGTPATPPSPGSAWTGETVLPAGACASWPGSEASGAPLSPLSSTDSSGSGSEASGGSSVGVAGGHKARALRYRLLRRQLEQAFGCRASDDCSPLASVGNSSPSLSLGGKSAVSELPSASPPQGCAVPLPTPHLLHNTHTAPSSPAGKLAPEPAVGAELLDEAAPEAEASGEAEGCSGATCGAPAARPPQPLPPPASCLADHLSDASASTAGTPAGWGSPAEGAAPVSSSCSTLGTLGAPDSTAVALTAWTARVSGADATERRGSEGGRSAHEAASKAEAAALLRRGNGHLRPSAHADAVVIRGSALSVGAALPPDAASTRSGSSRGVAALRALKQRLAAGRRCCVVLE